MTGVEKTAVACFNSQFWHFKEREIPLRSAGYRPGFEHTANRAVTT
jgi:hypothetical protein